MKSFVKYAGLLIAIQGLLWILLLIVSFALTPALDYIVEKFAYIYYPTVALVKRYGNYKGDENIIRPILIGVPAGIFIYSLIFALIYSYFKTTSNPD